MRDDRPYERHSEFYQTEREHVIRRSHSLPHIDLLDVVQPAGDFSDKASRDIVIQRTLCRCRFHADYGAGRFSDWSSHGGFIMAPPGTYAEIVIDADHRLDMTSLKWDWLRSMDAEGVLPADGDFGSIHGGTQRDAALDQLIDALWMTDPVEDGLRLDGLVAGLVDRLGQWTRDALSDRQDRRERLAPYALKRCLDLLDTDAAAPAILAEMAALVGLSPYHFCRAFKATTGLPPHRYRIVKRMERAKALIASRGQSIADVAMAVGYEDVAYFSRLFRRETGLSPLKWQQERLS